MFDYQGFTLDNDNEGWVKGWIVFNDDETTYVTIYKTEKEAQEHTEREGKPFAYAYGSHKANSDEFAIDSYQA